MIIMLIVDYFKELPFYNVPLGKPIFKPLKNVDLLAELPFHKRLSIIKTDHAFSGYAMSYKVDIVDKKNLIVQLEGSRSGIKDLLNDLLNKTRGFRYQITVKFLLNTNLMKKLNLLQFILIHQQKQ